MLTKVHFRLTLLCTVITAVIMLVCTGGFLYVSETSLYRSSYLSFKNDVTTIITNLEQQPVISFEWLAKIEASRNYIISILDNGVPFLYNSLRSGSGADGALSDRESLLSEALSYYDETYFALAPADIDSLSPYSTYHAEYEFTASSTGKNYYGCVATMGRGTAPLQMILVLPQDSINAQILEQRFLFLVINLLAVFSLTVFSWFFTWKLLKPVEKSRKQQNQFIAAASHELRTPLAVITSCLAAVKAALGGSSAGDTAGEALPLSFLGTIESESIRMSALIGDMLSLSQADNHTWIMDFQKLQPDTLLLNAYETFEAMALEQGIRLSIELPETPLLYLRGDPDRLAQVLAVFIHNALHYTPAGGRVTLSLILTKKQVGFQISDTGPGIPPEERENIFRRFYRIDKSRSVKGHSGLGLSIAREIVEAHRGRITVDNNPDGGAVFRTLFPLADS